MDAVDAAAGPEIDHHELSLQLVFEGQRLVIARVQPGQSLWNLSPRHDLRHLHDSVQALFHTSTDLVRNFGILWLCPKDFHSVS